MPIPSLAPTAIKAKAPPRLANPLSLTKPIATAIHLMVWEGLDRKEASRRAGITDHGLYQALTKPHVKAALLEQYEVLRTSARPRAHHKLEMLMDRAESERVQLEAAKYLDSNGKSDMQGVHVNVGINLQPGYLVDITEHAGEAQQIAHQARMPLNPLKTIEHVPEDDGERG